MELEGVVHDGVIVPESREGLTEGTRVRIIVASADESQPFGRRYAQLKGQTRGLPEDFAAQHDHYRLGTPKR